MHVRDYIHVEDLASGIVAALERGQLGQTYNLGSGVGLSTTEVLERMTALGKPRQRVLSTLGRVDETGGQVDSILNALLRAKGRTADEPQIEFESALSLGVARG